MTPKLEKYNLIDQFGQGRIINPNKGKFIVSSMWIYKMKYATDGNIQGYKEIFVVSLKMREYTMA